LLTAKIEQGNKDAEEALTAADEAQAMSDEAARNQQEANTALEDAKARKARLDERSKELAGGE
jgi:hypothetical protein